MHVHISLLGLLAIYIVLVCPEEANKKMMEEMAALKAASAETKHALKTPPPKIPAPSPAPSPAPKPAAKQKITPPPEISPPLTEGARLNRLRRLCEVKPSGKCNVPEQVHLRWKNSTKEEKETMCDELDILGWSKDMGSIY